MRLEWFCPNTTFHLWILVSMLSSLACGNILLMLHVIAEKFLPPRPHCGVCWAVITPLIAMFLYFESIEEQVLQNILLIGHNSLTNSYLSNKNNPHTVSPYEIWSKKRHPHALLSLTVSAEIASGSWRLLSRSRSSFRMIKCHKKLPVSLPTIHTLLVGWQEGTL